eukprot:TRINITY_DN1805_c0_g1_i1.p1 TRINITY_DN1805_c0_g1~~TRINITY_DN1805_c0_g1_i1.p1  ORF type:complete len:507 (-),score=121.09 TRINITY_DN1805_c0_g1_i1:496-2016(-)
MDASLSIFPDELLSMLCPHLPAPDLLALCQCSRACRRVCLSSIKAVAVTLLDNAHAEVFLNPMAPAGWTGEGFQLNEVLYAASPDRRVAAGPQGHNDAASLLSFVRSTATRRFLLLGGPERTLAGNPQPSTPFLVALLGGLSTLSLRALVTDGDIAAAAARQQAVRFPPALEALALADMRENELVSALPAVSAALTEGSTTLRSLRLCGPMGSKDRPEAGPVLASYLRFPLPALRSLTLFGRFDGVVARAVADLASIETLRLACLVTPGAVAELALPRLPRLRVVEFGHSVSQDPAGEEPVVRGRALDALTLSAHLQGNKSKVHVVLTTAQLPKVLVMSLPCYPSHMDMRPLCAHAGHAALRSLSFAVQRDGPAILAAVAAGLTGLRELFVFFLQNGADDFIDWPPALAVERLAFCTFRIEAGMTGWLVNAVTRSPSLVACLHRLTVDAQEPLAEETVQALGRLTRLTALTLTCRGSDAVNDEKRAALALAVKTHVLGTTTLTWEV